VLIGQGVPRAGLGRWRESLADRLMRLLPGVDVRIVADRALRDEQEDSE
jgi:K+-sensing histidine kinase KdpD